MRKVNRTAQCKNCGGVLFKIKPSAGYVIYDCIDCNDEERVRCDKYETTQSICEECGGDTFKVAITVDEHDNSHEIWTSECVKCKSSPKSVYVDNNGNLIDEGVRGLLIMKDSLTSLEEDGNTQKEIIEKLKEEVNNLNNELEEKDKRINTLEEKDNGINDLEFELEKKDNCINDLEYELETSKIHSSELEECILELEYQIEV